MARARILPHLELSQDSVTWGDWWVRINGRRILAGKRVDGWDYATPITFELQPSVSTDQALASCGLTSLRDIDVVLLAESPHTGRRFTVSRNVEALAENGGVLPLELPPEQIARSVVLSAFLVLGRMMTPRDDDVAWRRGARLAQSSRETVWLEGDAPRFPTEAVAFSSVGLEGALWDLDISFTDLDESFLSTVRLLVNTEHPAADMLLDEAHPGFPNAHSVLEIDIARRLIHCLATDDALRGDLARPVWQEGSTREVLETIAETVFGSNLISITELAKGDPRRFERKLQSRFDLFGGHR
jgi:hypothetical protein